MFPSIRSNQKRSETVRYFLTGIILTAILLASLHLQAFAASAYQHDPMQNPKAAEDIIVNPDAVYGYSPNPESKRLGEYASYDWTDPAFVAEAKANREKYLADFQQIFDLIKNMKAEGKGIEEIARAASALRNEIRLAAYKNDPEGLEKVKKSNLETYGNENGPTPEYLYAKYGTWEGVLSGATSSNPGMDACTGLYDEMYDTYGIDDEKTPDGEKTPENILAGMTLEEKISQMIIPAIRSWNGANVTDLNAVPELAEALRKHQYGGIILYGVNITDEEQTARLVSDLQKNNAQIEASTKIPYLMPLDMEGGIVNRLSMGTRMTGNMAIGATGDQAVENAVTTGRILGEEMAALGFNADFAPSIDVNNNPANPVIGTRSFSDDPVAVGPLGIAFHEGLAQSQVVGTYKHFPGHGDTGEDSHIATPTVEKTLEELETTEFVPFREAIANGADMIMTAHITYPLIDDIQTFNDGTTGYYPATMSHKMMTEILRENMGYDGVIVTDALEMDGISKGSIVPGIPFSDEYAANIAEKVINAGVDILLLPTDLNGTDVDGWNKIDWYDAYISHLIQKISDGTISTKRIDESVLRILKLKEKYGILDLDTSGADIEERVEKAKEIVGSPTHHADEMELARQAITLVRNEENTLPLTAEGQKIVLAGRNQTDLTGISNILSYLVNQKLLPEDVYIRHLVTGETTGKKDSDTWISIGYYVDNYEEGSELQKAVKEADAVVAISNSWGLSDVSDTAPQYLGIQAMTKDVQKGGGRMIVLSDNLPYDSARYQNADAIVLAYMGSGLGTDPTERESGNIGAYNANVFAAFATIFGDFAPTGKLPVNVPSIAKNKDGSLCYTDQILYPRGFGLTYPDRIVYAAYIGDTGYATLQEAVDAAKDGDVIVIDPAAAGPLSAVVGREISFTILNEGGVPLSIAPAEGYEMKVENGVYTFTKQKVTPDKKDEEKKITPSDEKKPASPEGKTGDPNDILLWSVLMAVAVAIVLLTVWAACRKKNES